MSLKLLFDQNLSRRLVDLFSSSFPGSMHVKDAGLAGASDRDVWAYALHHDFTIISKDADFHQMSFLLGAPPKTIWLRTGNCTTAELAEIIFRAEPAMHSFLVDGEGALLILEK